jgi:hypothetical protein
MIISQEKNRRSRQTLPASEVPSENGTGNGSGTRLMRGGGRGRCERSSRPDISRATDSLNSLRFWNVAIPRSGLPTRKGCAVGSVRKHPNQRAVVGRHSVGVAGGDQRPQSQPSRLWDAGWSDILAERNSDDCRSRAIVQALQICPTQRTAGYAAFQMSAGLMPD